MSSGTLYKALATMPDPRSQHGKIHPLPAVLGRVALAMLMGRTSLIGIAQFGRQHGTPLAHAIHAGFGVEADRAIAAATSPADLP